MRRLYLLLFICLIPISGYGQSDSIKQATPDEIFLKFNYANVIDVIIPSYFKDDKIYVPPEDILNILQIYFTRKGEKLLGFLIEKDSTYEFDFSVSKARYNKKNIILRETDFLKEKNKYYILPEIFKKLFNFDVTVNFSNQTIALSTDQKIPALSNFERQGARFGQKNYKPLTSGPLLFERKRNWLNTGYIDYNFSASGTKYSIPNYSYDLALGSEVAGGEFDAYLRGSFADQIKEGKLNGSFVWRYVLGQNKFLNQLNAGRIVSNGLNPVELDGFQITNAVPSPRLSFGNFIIRDKTVPNSDVELYINNQLFDFKKSDEFGNYFFEIPLTYGSNTIFVKIYGANGEIIERNKRIQVPGNYLPAGEINYNFNYGRKSDTKEYLYQANLTGGITNWLTNSIGADYVHEQSPARPLLYNTISARLFSEYLFNYTVAPDLYHKAAFNAVYYSQISFGLIYTKYKQNDYYNRLKIDNSINTTASLPIYIGDLISSSQFRGDYYKYQDLKTYNYIFEQSFDWKGNRPFFSYKYFRSESGAEKLSTTFLTFGIISTIPIFYKIFPFMSGNLFSASTDYSPDAKKFQNLILSLATNITNNARAQFNFNRNYTAGETDYSLQLTVDLSILKSYFTAGKNSVNATIQGSLGFDVANDKMIMYNRELAGTGSVTFRMYIDKNGNGKYDKNIDEIITDDIGVDLKEGITYERGSDKLLRVTNLIPNIDYSVEIKDEKMKNPYLVPKYKNFTFTADPNGYKEIDVPFYYTAEINGTVKAIRGNSVTEIPGVYVSIKDEKTGELKKAITFSDGSFYVMGLLPGKYRAFVDPEVVDRYKAKSEPQRIFFEIKGSKTQTVKELNFVLKM